MNELNPALADLARLRDIAEEGRRLPLAGGRHMILWGYAVFVAIAVQAAIMLGWLALPPIAVAFGWTGIMLSAALVARTARFNAARRAGRADLGSRIERTVWLFGGSFLALAPLSTVAAATVAWEQAGDPRLFTLLLGIPALTFGVYAVALAASAELAAFPLLKRYALLSLLFVPVTILTAGSPWQFAAVAIGIVLVSIVPGHLMLAAERAAERVGGRADARAGASG